MRSATVVGMVGAAGIGVVLWEVIGGFYFAQTCAVMLMIISALGSKRTKEIRCLSNQQ